jgi:hypothetical protein
VARERLERGEGRGCSLCGLAALAETAAEHGRAALRQPLALAVPPESAVPVAQSSTARLPVTGHSAAGGGWRGCSRWGLGALGGAGRGLAAPRASRLTVSSGFLRPPQALATTPLGDGGSLRVARKSRRGRGEGRAGGRFKSERSATAAGAARSARLSRGGGGGGGRGVAAAAVAAGGAGGSGHAAGLRGGPGGPAGGHGRGRDGGRHPPRPLRLTRPAAVDWAGTVPWYALLHWYIGTVTIAHFSTNYY